MFPCLFQVLFAVFDSVQGFVIITVHCAMRREVSPVSSLCYAAVRISDSHTVHTFLIQHHTVTSLPSTGGTHVHKCHVSFWVSLKSWQNTNRSDMRRISMVFMSYVAVLLLHNAV